MEIKAVFEKDQTAMANISPTDRAYLALSTHHDEQALVELAGKYVDATEIKDKTDYQMVMRGGIELQKARVAIEKTGKAARDDANKFRQAVIDEEKRLIAIIKPEHDRLRALRRDYDQEQERLKLEARQAEERRVSDITGRIQDIRRQSEGMINADAETIQATLDAVRSIITDGDLFAEFGDEATAVKKATVTALEKAYDERVELEEQQAEAARIAQEQAERQAELDRQAEEQLERERVAHEKIDAKRREAARIMREAQDLADAEAERVRGRELCLQEIRASADGAAGLSADEIRDRITALDQTDLSEEVWQEFKPAARLAVEASSIVLEQAFKDRLKLNEEKADLERREAEQRDAEEKRLAAEREEAEAARLEALKTEIEKLLEWAEFLSTMTGPKIDDKVLQELRDDALCSVVSAGHYLLEAIDHM